jgi:hypothetical protein
MIATIFIMQEKVKVLEFFDLNNKGKVQDFMFLKVLAFMRLSILKTEEIIVLK